jgi:hypothetical protein
MSNRFPPPTGGGWLREGKPEGFAGEGGALKKKTLEKDLTFLEKMLKK